MAASVLIALAGCSSSGPGSPGAAAPSAQLPSTVGPPASLGPTVGPGGPGASPTIAIDASLLAILPTSVGGLTVIESTDGEDGAMADPGLPSIASAFVAGVAVDTSTSDLVYALVVRLRPGALTDATFRDWRDSYDEGACGGPSAVVGNAEATIAGRTTFIGTCATGLHTYHVWITDKNLLISASSTGTRLLGEALIAGLQP